MKFAVIGANGNAGSRIAAEATSRGHDVTAVVRRANESEAAHELRRDAAELTAEDLSGFDVVVDALSFPLDAQDQHAATVTTIADALAGTDTRLIVVGGAGSLFVDEAHSKMLAETPDFPEAFLPVARGQIRQLEVLRGREDVRWTFISPAADFRADGERTGEYVQAGEEFTTDAEGASAISYADYAVGLVDEAEADGDAAHVNERISLRW